VLVAEQPNHVSERRRSFLEAELRALDHEATEPSHGSPLVGRRLLGANQEQNAKCYVKRDMPALRCGEPDELEIAAVDRPGEADERGGRGCHERMFALKSSRLGLFFKVLVGRTEVNPRKRFSLARSTPAAERPAPALTEGLQDRGEPFAGFDVDADDLEHRRLPVDGKEVPNLSEERPRRSCGSVLPDDSLGQRLAGVEQERLVTPACRIGHERAEVSEERSDQRVKHGSPSACRLLPFRCW
jgi:hypothetical protein